MTDSTHAGVHRTASATEGARDPALLRRINLERVLAIAMTRDDPFTRTELIELTGLSAPTIGNLTSSLIHAGLLTDLGAGPSRGGRRPSRMEFNARHGFVGGIDLGPTHTRLAVADLRGELLAHRVVPTPQQCPAPLLEELATSFHTLMRDVNVTPDRLLAVGAGAPGVVDLDQGMIVAVAPNLSGWSRVPMGAILADALGVPVVVENDINLAVLGEHWKGAARGHHTCAFLSFGTGIGAGILVKGQLHHGHHFLAGEIGLMCMGVQYVETDYGARGCLESITGLRAIKAQWCPDRSGDADWIPDLFRAAESSDPVARRTVDALATYIGIAAANVCSVLDPSLIVLGGALLTPGGLLEPVRQIVARTIPMPATVTTTALDKDAPLWGSLLVATNAAKERVRKRLGEKQSRSVTE